MEKDRIKYAKYMILRYVDTLFSPLSTLLSEELELITNLPSHGLKRDELVIVLYELFGNYSLVAMTQKRGLFTPTLAEIELALGEKRDDMYTSNNTFYGLTTSGLELLRELEKVNMGLT